MKITINTEVLKRNNLSLGDFLVMLMGYHNIDYEQSLKHLVDRSIVGPSVFNRTLPILSDNSKRLVAKILVESDDRCINSGIDFEGIANKLRAIYPEGNKAGTTYSWRGTTEEIAQKLRVLVSVHNFTFTEEEAINAVSEYVSSFADKKHMRLLKYFILKTQDEVDSLFMTTIENNRDNHE